MAIIPFSLSAALQSIGTAEVFVGDPLTSNMMVSLGATEGGISFKSPQTLSELTAPELTGDTPHQANVAAGKATIDFKLIMGDSTIWSKISPINKASGGTSSPIAVVETSCLMIPRAELGPLTGSGLVWNVGGAQWSKNGVVAAGSAPKNAIWLWRVFLTFGDVVYAYANGGKVLVDVTAHAMFDTAKPEYNKIYTIGDPRALSSPIAVLL